MYKKKKKIIEKPPRWVKVSKFDDLNAIPRTHRLGVSPATPHLALSLSPSHTNLVSNQINIKKQIMGKFYKRERTK